MLESPFESEGTTRAQTVPRAGRGTRDPAAGCEAFRRDMRVNRCQFIEDYQGR